MKFQLAFIGLVVLLFASTSFFGLWDVLEPSLAGATLAFTAIYWYNNQSAKKKTFIKGEGDYVIGVQVGRPVAQAINNQFGQCDALIDIEEVLGTSTLSTDKHYRMMVKAIYEKIAKAQNRKIHLVLSGTLGMSFLAGQLVGLHHFDITVHQFDRDSGGYKALPKPTRDWLSVK